MEEIVLFGTGRYFETKLHSIQEDYKVSVCLDNNVRPSESRLTDTGITVINPVDLKDDNVRIFLMSVRFISMWKQLVDMGVDPCRIVYPYNIQPYFENDMALTNGIQRLLFEKENIYCVLRDGKEKRIRDEEGWRGLLREMYRKTYPLIDAVSSMNTEPISRQFGTERGVPVDRQYIEIFLKDNQKYITGDVLEVEDAFYTEKYGTNITKSYVMDVSSTASGITFNANLETGEGVREGVADCFILTQTLMYVFDLASVVKNIYRLLKSGGVALITCSGISQNSRRCMDDYGCIFNFNADALRRMFNDRAHFEIIDAGSYGNVKTVTAHIAGLCVEDLNDDDFVYNDKYYPLISYIVVRRVNA